MSTNIFAIFYDIYNMYDTYTNLYSTNISIQYIICAQVRP